MTPSKSRVWGFSANLLPEQKCQVELFIRRQLASHEKKQKQLEKKQELQQKQKVQQRLKRRVTLSTKNKPRDPFVFDLNKLRDSRGWTLREMSKITSLSPATLFRLERGLVRLTFRSKAKLKNFLPVEKPEPYSFLWDSSQKPQPIRQHTHSLSASVTRGRTGG